MPKVLYTCRSLSPSILRILVIYNGDELIYIVTAIVTPMARCVN